MIYRQIGTSDVRVSIVGLGGHEYLPNGKSRGFDELPEQSVQPGFIMDGFGQAQRLELVRFCYDQGINLFDATMDSEKDALGRNPQQCPPPYPVYVRKIVDALRARRTEDLL